MSEKFMKMLGKHGLVNLDGREAHWDKGLLGSICGKEGVREGWFDW